MLKTPPIEVRKAMRLLANTDHSFKTILSWLQAEREDAVRTLSVSRDQWSAAQHGGCVQTLDAFLDHVEHSTR